MCGIIANPSPAYYAYEDATYCGWYDENIFSRGGEMCSANSDQADGWPGWQAGDEGIFKLDATAGSLKVRLRRTGRSYIIIGLPSPADSWRACVLSIEAGTSVSLSTVSDEERALVN